MSRPQSDRLSAGLLNRRCFQSLMAGAAFGVASVGSLAVGAESVTLQPSSSPLMRVRVEMELEGNVNVPDNPLVSRKSELVVPLKSEAKFEYEERYHRNQAGDSIPALERFYHEAQSVSTLNESKSAIRLRDSVRDVHVRRESLPETTYALEDYFTHDEVQLLRLPVSSAAVDQLLPTKPIAVGDKFAPNKDVLASLLNLASVESATVELEVKDIDDKQVRFEIKGDIDGSVEGVPTVIRTVGKITYDRKLKTSTWLAIAVHETREIGKAEPGFDVAATIKMLRKPIGTPAGLPSKAPSIPVKIPENRMYVDLKSEQIEVAMLMDRRWKMMFDVPGSAMMRMIDNDRSIAQCNLRKLASLEAGKQWTLEAFQKDVQQTLGDKLTALVEADQRVSAAGLRVLRVVGQGQVEGVQIQWVMLHFSDDFGRRVQATFTMDGESIAKFAGADVQLADSLRFLTTKTDDIESENTKPKGVATIQQEETRVADNPVSASDLR